MKPLVLESRSPDQTALLGRILGELARAGDVIALDGPLGAGKTCLAGGLAAGLGAGRDEPVHSPTFVLVREYAGRLPLFHIDAYRLSGAADLESLGFEEMRQTGVIVMEWAARAADLLPEYACRLWLSHVGPTQRRVEVAWTDTARLADVARRWAAGGLPAGGLPASPD